jgi:hypothetical protein
MDPKDYDTDPADDIDLDRAATHTVTGRRVTNAGAERMATEAEQRVNTRLANLIPGGKSLSGDGRHSPIVQTRVPTVIHAKLQAIADARHVSVSKVLREAIDEFVEREESGSTR